MSTTSIGLICDAADFAKPGLLGVTLNFDLIYN